MALDLSPLVPGQCGAKSPASSAGSIDASQRRAEGSQLLHPLARPPWLWRTGCMFGKKIKDPVLGQAQVLGVGLPVDSQGKVMRIRLQLLIEAPGCASQQVDTKEMVKRVNIPQAGMVLPVTVDRKDPSRFEIDWDAAPTRAGLMDAQAQSIMGAGGIGAPAAGTGSPADADERIARLEKLAALHAAGALTAEEFAAEKARLLGA